jgi:hypothetical protein
MRIEISALPPASRSSTSPSPPGKTKRSIRNQSPRRFDRAHGAHPQQRWRQTLQQPILAALNKIDFKALKGIDRVTLIRDYMLAFTRLGEPDAATKAELIAKLNPLFPRTTPALNRDLASCSCISAMPESSPKQLRW